MVWVSSPPTDPQDAPELPSGGVRVRYYAPVSTLEVSGGALLLCFVLVPLALVLGVALVAVTDRWLWWLALAALGVTVGGVALELWRFLARGTVVVDVVERTLRVRRTGPAWAPLLLVPTPSIHRLTVRCADGVADLVAEHDDGTATVVVRELLISEPERLAARLHDAVKIHEDAHRPRSYRA